ncbi:NADPH:quinone oxidoreductase [Steroidobacter agaridevorans]|uniref:NADPH:quinone oxidoreductase n=1 Tax=Steroidobacter agaridevorans TaxID=2695856 RepID=A0A829Y847_9GAMM|nr:NAD(P)-dependent alcohol dehydrogenase [Steroidobacter agaridevorans]GFE79469.1 NADPH:quinone oxidoreductase [Steroidobacter agaridevorans]
MKAVRLKAPASVANLCLIEETPPQPKAGEVLVRLRASSINPHDDFVVRGLIPSAAGRIPLSDGAGEVVACGQGVTALQTGDTVVSTFWPHWLSGEIDVANRRDIPGELIDGYAREYACMPAHAFVRAPKGFSHAESATLPCAGVTAWRGLVTQGKVKPGDTVLIMGSGAVSLFALQFAKAAGARVIATSSSDAKLERLKQLGADELINYKTTQDWGEQAKALTDGRGVDHVIEVGGPATLAQSMAACRLGGHIALIGVLSGFAGELLIPALFSAQLRVSGISVGSRTDLEDMIRAIEVNGLKPVIDRSFGLEQIVAAFEYYQAQRHFGKVTIQI